MDEIIICNLALSHVRAASITSTDGTVATLALLTKEAKDCYLKYPVVRDAVLEDHDWDFARKELELTEITTEEFQGWEYVYSYPTDCIIPRKIYDQSGLGEKIEYEIRVTADLEDRVIVTNDEDSILVYTAQVTDTTLFSKKFIDALSWRLAADLAISLKSDKELQAQCLKMYSSLISSAQVSNARAGWKEPSMNNSITDARF